MARLGACSDTSASAGLTGGTRGCRIDALKQYLTARAGAPTVEGALHAFLDADLDRYFEGGESWMIDAAFCARISNRPEGSALTEESRPGGVEARRHPPAGPIARLIAAGFLTLRRPTP